ncbi:collagen alpha-1(XIV) chain-like, partial [Heterocephalus glaber]|uniref:Collagen alpha-1(XIV) chain-like n=1 Tax=Heterocephalus glaber TaxID=10181 RepID=A0AAX6QKA0_HETGA
NAADYAHLECFSISFPVSAPTRLRYNVLSEDSVQISWKAPRGKFGGYKLLVTPASGGKTNQLNLQNTATKAIIQGLMPEQNYTVQIIAYHKDKESKPVQGQFRIKDLEKKKDPTKPRGKAVDKANGTSQALPEGQMVLMSSFWECLLWAVGPVRRVM